MGKRRLVHGASRLVLDATTRLTDVVEAMHHNIVRGPLPASTAHARSHGRTAGLTGFVYGAIRSVARLAGTALDAVTDTMPRDHAVAPPSRDIFVAALNGVVGDHLAATGNPLAIPMRLRLDGRALELTPEALAAAYPAATSKVVVLLHGSCSSDRLWLRRGHDHGQALARDLGFTPVYLHYNSGLHIHDNGTLFAPLLRELVAAWPVPIDELVSLCHSMGGLVVRSALHLDPTLPIDRVIFCGTPHHGSPLERAGNILDTVLGNTHYTGPLSRLGKLRSAGITDLRHGTIDALAKGDRFAPKSDVRPPVPLPEGIACYAIAASLTARPSALGDGLVLVDSALGHHRRPELELGLPAERCFVAAGIGHMDLLGDPEVYAQIATWLSQDGITPSSRPG